jgi:hypothetical protein
MGAVKCVRDTISFVPLGEWFKKPNHKNGLLILIVGIWLSLGCESGADHPITRDY